MKNLWISIVLLGLLPLSGWAHAGQQSDGLSDMENVNTNDKNVGTTGLTSNDKVTESDRYLVWDVNRDGEVTIADVNDVLDYILYGRKHKISSAYYLIGTNNYWTPFDDTYRLSNGGGDVYANPVFSVVIPATGAHDDNWFMIYSQETMDLDYYDFWSGDFIGYAESGENGMSGKFVEGDTQVAFPFRIPADIPADKFRLTFDMMNCTFEFEAINEIDSPDLCHLVGSCAGLMNNDKVTGSDRYLAWDVNRDGEVTLADVNEVIDYILNGSNQKISSAYYYIGTSNNWSPYDATYKLSNEGDDLYDDPVITPVFTVVIPAVYTAGNRVDNWFKIYSQETMESEDFWGSDFIGYAVNGENEMSGRFVEGANNQVAFAFKIPADIPADEYRLTFDMKNRTFEFKAFKEIDSPDLWYLVGSCIGDGSWSNNPHDLGTSLVPLYPQPDNYSMLKYVGYFPAGGGFRLIHTPGMWDEQWGMSDGHLVKNDVNSDYIQVAEDGYYQIAYDLNADIVTITKYTGFVNVFSTMGMPGEYQDWSPAAAPQMSPMSTVYENHDWIKKYMTFDSDTYLKFVADGDWDMNWGDDAFPVGVGIASGNVIPVRAGTYTVVFNDILGTYNFIKDPE